MAPQSPTFGMLTVELCWGGIPACCRLRQKVTFAPTTSSLRPAPAPLVPVLFILEFEGDIVVVMLDLERQTVFALGELKLVELFASNWQYCLEEVGLRICEIHDWNPIDVDDMSIDYEGWIEDEWDGATHAVNCALHLFSNGLVRLEGGGLALPVPICDHSRRPQHYYRFESLCRGALQAYQSNLDQPPNEWTSATAGYKVWDHLGPEFERSLMRRDASRQLELENMRKASRECPFCFEEPEVLEQEEGDDEERSSDGARDREGNALSFIPPLERGGRLALFTFFYLGCQGPHNLLRRGKAPVLYQPRNLFRHSGEIGSNRAACGDGGRPLHFVLGVGMEAPMPELLVELKPGVVVAGQ